mmetsp:Transcript_19833/g.36955  ORF Transcript_19833/g.36955 Transcript_19833/m.36955 type:complete len:226 (-) Transcript_19833:711-1388(-)
MRAHHFPTGVHAELGHARVDASDSRLLADDGPYRGAAGAVVPHYELLDGHVLPPSDFADDEAGERVGGVPLVAIGLDDDASVEIRGVVLLVLGGVVGVNGVGHVDGEDERAATRGLEEVLVPPPVVQSARDTAHGLPHDRGPGSALARTSYLLVIEEAHHGDVGVLLEHLLVRCVLRQALDGRVARGLVVEAGGVQELLVGSSEGRGLGVIEGELEVGDLSDLDT